MTETVGVRRRSAMRSFSKLLICSLVNMTTTKLLPPPQCRYQQTSPKPNITPKWHSNILSTNIGLLSIIYLFHKLMKIHTSLYSLKPMRHELTLEIKHDSRNFIERLLFKDKPYGHDASRSQGCHLDIRAQIKKADVSRCVCRWRVLCQNISKFEQEL